MKRINFLKSGKVIVGALVIAGLAVSCKKKGCIDENANNYDVEAKKDDGSCVYPTINLNSTGNGDVVGSGGSASSTTSWTNGENRAEMNMDITAASGGTMTIIIEDAVGKEVLNESLEVGVGDDSKNVCSDAGTSGEWSVTVILTDFDGDGSFSLSQGC